MIRICPILSLAKHMSEVVGTNNGSVQCQWEECMFFNASRGICIISREKPELRQEATDE